MNAQTRREVRTREIRTWTRASSNPRPSPSRHPRAPPPRLSPVKDPRAPVTTRRLWRRSSTRPRRRAPIEPMSRCYRCLYYHPRIPRRGPWRRRRWSAAWRACSWSWSERRRPADLYRPTTRTVRDRRTGRTAYTLLNKHDVIPIDQTHTKIKMNLPMANVSTFWYSFWSRSAARMSVMSSSGAWYPGVP